MIDPMEQVKNIQNNMNEDRRNNQLVTAILELAKRYNEANVILNKQCNELQKRNEMLKNELDDSRKETKRSVIFNIISTAVAVCSLVSTLLIAFLK